MALKDLALAADGDLYINETGDFEIIDSRCSLGQYRPHDRYADDPQDLCLCVDRSHRLFCYEEGM